MKKILSLVLALVMLLGCMSVTAFAATDNTTDITLTVAKELTYDMVIPEAVSIDAAGVYAVGQAKVANVKNATDKTVISYTATTTNFKSEGKSDIPASYYTDAQGDAAFPTTAVEVYKNKTDAASIPTMYVGISEAAWNAAENGTYTATVTFNFEVKAPKTFNTVADAIDTISDLTVFTNGQSEGASCSWKNEHDGDMWRSINTDPVSDCLTFINWEQCNLPVSTALTKTENGYTCTFEGATFVFAIENDVLKSVTVSNLSDNLNGVWVRPTLAGDILADFPSSENMVTPPQEAWVNENGASAYKFRSMLIFSVPGQDMAYITLGDTVTKSGDDYVWQDRWSDASAVFNMNGETLESIVVSGFTGHYPEDSNGTYTAPTVD